MNIPRAALGALTVLAAVAGPAVAQLPTLELSAGIHLIRAEVANTFDARARGLMFRKSLGAGSGMLFVFPEVSRHCMWMKNTYVPLSVAFMDEQGTIVSIHDMKPQDEHQGGRPDRRPRPRAAAALDVRPRRARGHRP